MKKHILSLFAVTLAFTVTAATAAAALPDGGGAQVAVVIDGEPATVRARLVNDTSYVSVREFATALGASNVYRVDNTSTVVAPRLKLTASLADKYIVANGRYLLAESGLFTEGEEIYAPIRALATAFDAATYWSGATRTVFIVTGSGAITSGDKFYSKDDVYWMSRIIYAEARGEPFLGKVAVGNVVMNRIECDEFPKTVKSVIFDKKNGVQFTPVSNGSINNTPNEECIIAAKLALEGSEVVGDSLYFSSTTKCWAARKRPYVTSVGGHVFYA
ncbi:MAG: cell wall hydrolase [Oscillospiraceae bacterium]|jgi:N-acetylmuramoyl-L-alanine amidase|nr:cell wall hydrolase [Oscillospiraceae bacterium]